VSKRLRSISNTARKILTFSSGQIFESDIV
jgi:hypothetical protein